MPKYFANRAAQLHIEAFATYLLISAMPINSRTVKLTRKAQERVYRRYSKAQGAKC